MANPHEPGTEEWARHETRPYVSRWGKQDHDKSKCCASVHDSGFSVGFHQCTRNPKVYYGSFGYCRQHDPAALIAKREERDRKFRKKWEDMEAKAARQAAERRLRDDALAAIRQIAAGHNDPRALAVEVLERAALAQKGE